MTNAVRIREENRQRQLVAAKKPKPRRETPTQEQLDAKAAEKGWQPG